MQVELFNYLNESIGFLEVPEGMRQEDIDAVLAKHRRPPIKVYPHLSPRQMRLALVHLGFSLEELDALFNALPSPQKELAKTEWEYATYFERENPLLLMMIQILNWTVEQVDEFWNFASTF